MTRGELEELLGKLTLSEKLNIEQHDRSFVLQMMDGTGTPISLCRISAESYLPQMGSEELTKFIIDTFFTPIVKGLAEEARQKQFIRIAVPKPSLRLAGADEHTEPVPRVHFDKICD